MFFVVYFTLPGSTRSGEKARKMSRPTLSPLLEHRHEDLVGRPRVRRALQDDQHVLVDVLRHLLGGVDDIGEVGVLRLAQRRGDADVDRIGLRQRGKIGCDPQKPGRQRVPDRLGGNIADVRLPRAEGPDFRAVHVDADHRNAGPGVFHGERQPHVPQADHGRREILLLQSGEQIALSLDSRHRVPSSPRNTALHLFDDHRDPLPHPDAHRR
jgi:hypothetical protein